ncbi:F0F1 ATP synthase subunit A [Clostridium haemolyticum]|uniref:ATP synthase subunit a n=1 Tax=Clostridium haemolyticum NCTC 9693 TaxID=1443114 RepID=A0ABR4TFW6_CLOHA|nr:F0F1 ATP synthase subunit A [Clostridium haemolyticum]KEI17499.1 ATP synthase F0F1 subunit A [Clostridium haemolyticum NCTC 9693]KGN04257.1 ATP synthase F0F1 subunit A [Clostridium haemolyticum NCTC 8350]OOB76288.1 F0F1 ATP synthase subunit A [Clostridium haemolyticum]CAG7839301.1 ATP synthase subunit a [Clostridium haemolyticum]
MEEGKVFYLNLSKYKIAISNVVVIQWVIILITLLVCIMVTRKLKKVPGKRQTVVEMFVEGIKNVVKNIMGEGAVVFAPYVGTLVVFLLLMNLAGLVGIEPPTKDFSVTCGVAAISFVVIQAYAIKKQGLIGYFKGYVNPVWVLFPINIMERIMLPVSLSLRLFGNITAAVVIMDLVYKGLSHLPFGIAQLGLPIPLHFYFDVFDGGLQMIIFTMLTMINIKIIAEH